MKIVQRSIHGLRHQIYVWGKESLPKLFFLHGWMDTGASFQWIAERLQEEFCCIAPDLRGFGRSEHSPNPLGYFFVEYIADAHELFRQWSPEEPIRAIGHSMGGNILSLYAGAFPDRVSHLVNLEGFGIADFPETAVPAKVRDWIEHLGQASFRLYPDSTEMLVRLRKNNPSLQESQARFLLPFLTCQSPGGYNFSADPKHKNFNPHPFQLKLAEAFWEKIRAHCLLLAGAQSAMPQWLQGEALQQEFARRWTHFPSDAERHVLPNCGHQFHWEKPEEIAKLTRAFLKVR